MKRSLANEEAVPLLARRESRRIASLVFKLQASNMKQLPRWSQFQQIPHRHHSGTTPAPSRPGPCQDIPGGALRRHPHSYAKENRAEFFLVFQSSNNTCFRACGDWEDDICVGWNSVLRATFASASANNTLFQLYLFSFSTRSRALICVDEEVKLPNPGGRKAAAQLYPERNANESDNVEHPRIHTMASYL
jgi:hypothetical protein